MQSQTPLSSVGGAHFAAPTITPHLNAPGTERQLAELQQAWLEYQINPLGEVQWRGVPDSPLHD